MKRLIALMLMAVMVFSLAACGGNATKEDKAAEPTEAAENEQEAAPAEEGETEEETPAEEGETEEKADGEGFKAAMITDVGGINDQSYNSMSWAGMQLAEKELGIEVKYYESKTDADYESNMITAIDEGYDLIICVGYLMVDALTEVAGQYPDVQFAIIDSQVDLPNVTGIRFASEQCSYLVGVLAAEMSETGNIGLVMGGIGEAMDLFAYGYYAGAIDTNPDIQIQEYNANSYSDVAGGKTAALRMFTNGADVVYQVAGSTGLGVIEAAKEEGLYAIGVEVDQSYLAPEAVLTSALRLIDNAVLKVCQAAMEGTLEGGIAMYDLSNECVGFAETDLLSEEALAAAKEAQEKIISGEIKVPTTKEDFEAAYGTGLYTLNEG